MSMDGHRVKYNDEYHVTRLEAMGKNLAKPENQRYKRIERALSLRVLAR